MNSKVTSDTRVYNVEQTINEVSTRIEKRRFYSQPQIIRLADSNIEGGTTTNLAEASGGVWNAGS